MLFAVFIDTGDQVCIVPSVVKGHGIELPKLTSPSAAAAAAPKTITWPQNKQVRFRDKQCFAIFSVPTEFCLFAFSNIYSITTKSYI